MRNVAKIFYRGLLFGNNYAIFSIALVSNS